MLEGTLQLTKDNQTSKYTLFTVVLHHLLQYNYFYYRLVVIAQCTISVLVTPVRHQTSATYQAPLFTELRLLLSCNLKLQGTQNTAQANH